MSVCTVKIGDLALNERGAFKIGPFGSSLKQSELVEAGIPVVGIENVLPNQFEKGFRRFVTPEKFQELSDYEITNDDVLVTTMGTIGRAAVVPQALGKAIFDSHLFRMRVNTERVFPPYLCYALNSNVVDVQLQKMARGAIMQGLNTTILRECEIPLPNVPEQKRIAALLEQADRLRRTRRYALELSDAFLLSAFEKVFGAPLIASEGRKIERLEDVLTEDPQNGLYVPAERYVQKQGKTGIAMVHMSDLFGGIVATGSLKRVILEPGELEKYNLSDKDILVARRSLNYDGAAKPCRIPTLDAPLVFESSMIRIRPNEEKVLPVYLYYYLSHDAVRQSRVRRYVTVSTISGINQDGLRRIEVVVPKLSLQRKFTDIVAKHGRLYATQRQALHQADHLFRSLLNRAFTTDQ